MTLYHPALTQAVALEHIRDLHREAAARRVRYDAGAGGMITDLAPRHRVARRRPAWWRQVTSFATRPLATFGRSTLITAGMIAVVMMVGAGAAWAGPVPIEPGSSGAGSLEPDGASGGWSLGTSLAAATLVTLAVALAAAAAHLVRRHQRTAVPVGGGPA